jgi:hypothetical protein
MKSNRFFLWGSLEKQFQWCTFDKMFLDVWLSWHKCTLVHHFPSINICHVQTHQMSLTVAPILGPRVGPVFQTALAIQIDAGHVILNRSTIQS